MKKIAVLGCGTVGSGVVEVFYKNRQSIQRKAGCPLDIKYIYLRRPRPELPWQDKLCYDFDTILHDPEISIVVEVMGGLSPAGEWIAACLKNNKSVVTANKELIAAQGAQLLALARQHQVNLLFEASVGGGIPIIRPLHQCLGANELDDIQGILNGTTNFILTKMSREGMSFSQALQMAQQLGYAEADPTADVQGLDACRKICILASLAFGSQLYPQLVHCQGITELTPEDVEYARNWGGVIKLIARAHRDPDTQQLSALVAPMFVPHDSQLSTVDDVFNGILVDGDATGQVLFYGKGAGKLPTASAVISDVIDCAKASGTIDTLFWQAGSIDECNRQLLDWQQIPARFYLRLRLSDPQQLAYISLLLDEYKLLSRPDQPKTEIALVTSTMTRRCLQEILAQLQAEGIVPLNTLFVLQ
ncbi:MAG: homoserine dehydrogenase [Negativibacillus sp.]|nr:homoserine dehydrogenase [Negativibacillus sp.]